MRIIRALAFLLRMGLESGRTRKAGRDAQFASPESFGRSMFRYPRRMIRHRPNTQERFPRPMPLPRMVDQSISFITIKNERHSVWTEIAIAKYLSPIPRIFDHGNRGSSRTPIESADSIGGLPGRPTRLYPSVHNSRLPHKFQQHGFHRAIVGTSTSRISKCNVCGRGASGEPALAMAQQGVAIPARVALSRGHRMRKTGPGIDGPKHSPSTFHPLSRRVGGLRRLRGESSLELSSTQQSQSSREQNSAVCRNRTTIDCRSNPNEHRKNR